MSKDFCCKIIIIDNFRGSEKQKTLISAEATIHLIQIYSIRIDKKNHRYQIVKLQLVLILGNTISYLPRSGNVTEVAGMTSMTRVKYRVCDTSMAMTIAVFSPD